MLPGRNESWRRDPRAGVLVIVAGVMLAGFLALLAAILLAPSFMALDVAVSEAIWGIDAPGLTRVAVFASDVGDFWPMALLTAATVLILAFTGRRPEALTVLLAVAVGTALGNALKYAVDRARPAIELARIPPLETGSFPSGHAIGSLLFFGSLAFVVLIDEKKLGRSVAIAVTCALAVLAIGLSRVYLGVHYLGDVVGAWLLGSAWLAFVVLISAYWGAGRANAES